MSHYDPLLKTVWQNELSNQDYCQNWLKNKSFLCEKSLLAWQEIEQYSRDDAFFMDILDNYKDNYTVFLTADYGNADYAINADGTPNTAHTLNLVPLFLIGYNAAVILKPGKLGDIAPTILTLMNLPIPKEMTGNILTN